MQRLILSKHTPCIFLYGPYIYVQYRNFVREIEMDPRLRGRLG